MYWGSRITTAMPTPRARAATSSWYKCSARASKSIVYSSNRPEASNSMSYPSLFVTRIGRVAGLPAILHGHEEVDGEAVLMGAVRPEPASRFPAGLAVHEADTILARRQRSIGRQDDFGHLRMHVGPACRPAHGAVGLEVRSGGRQLDATFEAPVRHGAEALALCGARCGECQCACDGDGEHAAALHALALRCCKTGPPAWLYRLNGGEQVGALTRGTTPGAPSNNGIFREHSGPSFG